MYLTNKSLSNKGTCLHMIRDNFVNKGTVCTASDLIDDVTSMMGAPGSNHAIKYSNVSHWPWDLVAYLCNARGPHSVNVHPDSALGRHLNRPQRSLSSAPDHAAPLVLYNYRGPYTNLSLLDSPNEN